MHKRGESIFNKLVLGFVFTFSLLCVIFLNSTQSQAVANESDITLSIDPVISLSLSNCDTTNSSTININIDPTPNGIFKSNCQTAEVNTNNPGYTLTVKASSSNLNYLNPTNLNPKPVIASTANTIDSPAIVSNNTWGFAAENRLNFDAAYSIDNENNKYSNLLTTDTVIYQTDQWPIITSSHRFFYGTKLNTDTTAGTYATTITYTAIASNIPEPPNYLRKVIRENNITTMQQLTSTICSNALYDSTNNGINTNNTVILTDTRNNQQYRVRKMPDNKCWMIDNLKIAGTTIYNSDSNITAVSYTIPPLGTRGSATSTPYVDDPALNSPNKDHCINNTVADGSNFTESYSPDSLAGCGYLYSFSAATAGTSDSLTTDGQNAPGSICPIGWRLPTGTATGDFAMLNGSMLNNSLAEPSTENTETSRANWFSTGNFSGSYAGYLNDSTWSTRDYYSRLWSSTINNNAFAYYTRIDYDILFPGTPSYGRHLGFSVRCIL